MEEKITEIETEKFLVLLDYFEFNGFNPPKFWFGDTVKMGEKWGDCTGIILGLQWRDGVKILPRGGSQNAGWWYYIWRPSRESLMGFHEDSLSLDISSYLTARGRSPPGGDAM